MSNHRAGVNDGFLTEHKLKLLGLNLDNAVAIHSDIDALFGVDKVRLDINKATIDLVYDASRQNIDDLLGIVNQHDVVVSKDWWNQFKLKWDRQTDQNIKNNAKYVPHSCNKMPSNKR